jgi:hypothetical protein
MSYRVFWSPHAEGQLERLLLGASNLPRLAESAREIDQRLAREPLKFGESRFEAVRIAFERPLAIHYEVLEDVETVIVYDVWRIDVKQRVDEPHLFVSVPGITPVKTLEGWGVRLQTMLMAFASSLLAQNERAWPFRATPM